MPINKIQRQIFKQLGEKLGIDVDGYIAKFSQDFLGKQVDRLEELTEEEGDNWITKAYLKSLDENEVGPK